MENTTQTTTGAGAIAAQFKDGQKITLSQGWAMSFVMNWDSDEPYLQAFVLSPHERDSASLYAARAMGVTTGDDIRIPAAVMMEIRGEEFDAHE